MMKFIFILSITLLSTLQTSLAQQKKWTLEECTSHAKEHNVQVLQNIVAAQRSELNEVKAKGAFLPDLNFSIGQNYISAFTNPSTNVTQSASSNTAPNLNASVNLFSGMSNWLRLELADLSLKQNEVQQRKIEQDLDLLVTNNYLQVLFFKETYKSAQLKLDNSLKQFEKKKNQRDLNLITEADVLEHEIIVDTDRRELSNAKYQVENSLIKLQELLNLETSKSFDILGFGQEVYAKSLDAPIYDFSISQNPILQVKAYDLDISEKNIALAKAKFLPTVSLSYTFGSNYYKIFNNTVPSPAFLTQLNANKQHYIGLSIQVPIFNRLQTQSDYRISKLEFKSKQIDYDYSKRELNNKVETARNELLAAQGDYVSTKKILNAQQKVFDFTTEKYDQGIISVYDYVESRTRMDRATSDFIRSKSNLLLKKKLLDYYQ